MARGITPEIAEEIRRRKGLQDTNLHRARIKAGMSQDGLSRASGVSAATIRGYESGARDIDGAKLETLLSLSAALRCNLTDILECDNLVEKFKLVSGERKND